jgi:hypothetical protein
MNDYPQVQQALATGADPAMLCATCPWDRNCVTPPTMTSGEIEAQLKQAAQEDQQRAAAAAAAGQQTGIPHGVLLTMLSVGGRDTMGLLCPVFALRLRSAAGRGMADQVKAIMQGFDDG